MSAPEAACARAISCKLRYFPVPTISRERNPRPAITNWSLISILPKLLYRAPGDAATFASAHDGGQHIVARLFRHGYFCAILRTTLVPAEPGEATISPLLSIYTLSPQRKNSVNMRVRQSCSPLKSQILNFNFCP